MDAKTLAAKLGGKPTTKGFMCRCPAHEDKQASLWVIDKEDGGVYVQCKTGNCDFRVIRQLLELDTPNGSNGKPHTSYSTNGDFTPVNICYEYKDELGKVLFIKEKTNDPKRKYIQKRPDGKGGYIFNLDGIEKKPLYNLPAILKAIREGKPIAILEGEKDCETFTRITGIPATTNFDGGGTWRDEYSLTLKGANIILCYDTDATGVKHKNAIKDSLLRLADPAALTIYHLPTELNGVFIKDFTDYIDNGGGSSLNGIRIENVKGSIENKTYLYTATNVEDFLLKPHPPKEHLLGPFIRQGLHMVYAPTGVGKTYFALSVAFALSTKGKFLDWRSERQTSVIYIDGELPAHVLQDRIRDLLKIYDITDAKGLPLKLVTPDEQKVTMPDLSTPEGQSETLKLIGDAEFIVIDNLSTLCRTGDENDNKTWLPFITWLLKLRTMGKSVLLVHHTGKAKSEDNDNHKTYRGGSRLTDILDLTISLAPPKGHSSKDGCVFEVVPKKTRHKRRDHPEDHEPVIATYTEFGWQTTRLEMSIKEQISTLHAQGWTKSQIIKEVGENRAKYVHRILGKQSKSIKGFKEPSEYDSEDLY